MTLFKMTIEGATLSELASNILIAAKQFNETVPEGNAKPTATRKTKAAEPEAEPATTEDKPLVDKMKDAVAAADAKAEPVEAVDPKALAARCPQYAAKAGAPALMELFGEFGASKWSEIPVEKYPALSARLDQLLAG